MKSGAKYYKCDLHVHTPASKDYRDKSASPEEIIQAAVSCGVEVLGVTDHNSVEWLDKMRKASKGTTITIVPGVEITTPHGHIIGLFELESGSAEIADLLVDVGIKRPQHGKEEAMSKYSTEDVIKEIADCGGLAIAAHANSSNGLLKEGKGQVKLRIVPMKELSALELGKEKDIASFSSGSVPKYPKKPCTHGSDAHALVEIGSRVTYLKMESPSLRGLRQALFDHEVRVRFPWSYREADYPRILSLKVDQGFFDGIEFSFHESLNCFVGGTGTGKSTVIELLRFCFDDPPSFASLLEDHEGKVATLLGEGGSVEVKYLDADGEVKIVRREVLDWPIAREVTDEAGNSAELESAPVFFSQGELIQVAAAPFAQMDLIDRRIDVDLENQEEREAIRGLERNALALTQAIDRSAKLKAKLEHPEHGFEATKQRSAQLEKQLESPVLKAFPNWEAEQSHLRSLADNLKRLADRVDEQLDAIDVDKLVTKTPDKAPNATQLDTLHTIPAELKEAISAARHDLRKAISAAQSKVEAVSKVIEPGFRAEQEKHKELLEGLGQQDVKKANAKFRAQKKRLETLKVHKVDARAEDETIKALREKRRQLREKLRSARKSRWEKRRSKASDLSKELEGVITVEVLDGGNRIDFATAVREISRGAKLYQPLIDDIVERLDPADLVDCILENDSARLMSLAGIDKAHADKLIANAGNRKLGEIYAIDVVTIADQPRVLYAVPGQRAKPLSELSTGQKGTVIIALAMIEGTSPLVIDQPEEPLDTQSIYGQIVQKLRTSKEDRQFVFTTHNPNIAVGADAELSHVLGASADRGYIRSSGGIDHPDTNRLLLLHLEGGPEALQLRIKKYEV